MIVNNIKVKNGILEFPDGSKLSGDLLDVSLDIGESVLSIREDSATPSLTFDLNEATLRVTRKISEKISDIQEMPLPTELCMIHDAVARISTIPDEGLIEVDNLVLSGFRNYMTRYLRFMKDEVLPEAIRG